MSISFGSVSAVQLVQINIAQPELLHDIGRESRGRRALQRSCAVAGALGKIVLDVGGLCSFENLGPIENPLAYRHAHLAGLEILRVHGEIAVAVASEVVERVPAAE